MLTTEFEEKLTTDYQMYFANPSVYVPGVNRDAEYYTAEQTLDILSHDADKMVKLVRRRSEQANSKTYYFKDKLATLYFKVVVPTTTGGVLIDTFAIGFQFKQMLDTIRVRLGLL